MDIKRQLRKSAAALAAAFTLLLCTFPASATLNGRWIQHPAASLRNLHLQGQIERIIDGNKYVYFCVRGDGFNRGEESLYSSIENFEPLQLFRYDKSLPWSRGNVRAVAQELDLSGVMISTVAYSPENRMLAAAYDNKKIDFIYDDGSLIRSLALTDGSVPLTSLNIFSITFDSGRPRAYVGLSSGYAVIDTQSGELVEFHNFGQGISWIARIGSRMVAFSGSDISSSKYATSTYVFPADNVPATLPAPTFSGDNLQVLMPLTDTSFAAVAPVGADTQSVIKHFAFTDSGLTATALTGTLTVDGQSGANYRHLFRTDGFVYPTAEGYAFSDNASITFIKKGVDFTPGASNTSDLISTISKSSLSASEKNSKTATFDGSKVWFYTYASNGQDASERGFYSRQVTDGVWEAASQVVAPTAPSSSLAFFGAWSDLYGLLLRGPGGYFWETSSGSDPLCGFDGNAWTEYGYNARNSKYAAFTGPSKYLDIDPINPHWVWGTSSYNCLFRVDLADKDNFLALTATNRTSQPTSMPGVFNVLPTLPYAQLVNFSNVDFDINKTMFVTRYVNTDDDYDYEKFSRGTIHLYYFTAEDRQQIANIGGDKSRLPALKKFDIPRRQSFHTAHLVAMKSPGNENLIATMPAIYKNVDFALVIYDHNGTLDDTSDDRIAYVEDLYDEDGNSIYSYNRMTEIYEDLSTGNLWFCTTSGPFILDPQDIMEGRMVCKRPRISMRDGKQVDESPFEFISINKITDDIYGRKWIGSDQGLYCLSADGKELLCQYSQFNSPMPSSVVLGIACNATTGSVYVMTDRGMVEFVPDGAFASIPEGNHLSVWPASVTPDYTGYVTISGAETGSEYVVCDKDGTVVANLGQPEGGSLQWNVRNADGQKPAAGRYSIKRSGRNESHTVTIM